MAKQRQKEIFFRAAGRRNIDEAQSALVGAKYHLDMIHYAEGGRAVGNHDPGNVLHFHIRGFFWEMYSVVDSVDHIADRPEFIVAWAAVVRGSQWFSEISAYRNLAHRMFHQVEIIRGAQCIQFMIQQALENQAGMVGLAQMRDYWNRMDEALKELLTRDEIVSAQE